jgi:hypothetical protein
MRPWGSGGSPQRRLEEGLLIIQKPEAKIILTKMTPEGII